MSSIKNQNSQSEAESSEELDSPQEVEVPEFIDWKEFLEKTPYNSKKYIKGFASKSGPGYWITWPQLWMYCPTESCESDCHFVPATSSLQVYKDNQVYLFITYTCRHCASYKKTFALLINGQTSGYAIKLGESPPYSPYTNPALKKLVTKDWDRYLKGLRAEGAGLGVGAFAYYRQVVENIKTQLFDKIIEVARLNPDYAELIGELEAAKKEKQFTKAIEQIKKAIPESLLYNGDNPLIILHDALSEELHEGTDEECLAIAQLVRSGLSDLAERIAETLKKTSQMDTGISLLKKRKQEKLKAKAQEEAEKKKIEEALAQKK